MAFETKTGTNTLPPDHAWDSEDAEREYQALGRRIAETEEQLSQAHSRLATVLENVYTSFTNVPGIYAVLGKGMAGLSKAWALEELNNALNPSWVPERTLGAPGPGGRIDPKYPPSPWQGSLVVASVERKTRQIDFTFYERPDTVPFTYEGRVERYTPVGDAGISALEQGLGAIRWKAERLGAKEAGLLEETIQEVHVLLAPLKEQMILTFLPDLEPTNFEDIHLWHPVKAWTRNDKIKQYLMEVLEWPPLAKYAAPKVGEYYGLASYGGICWVCHGVWKPYQFPQETLQHVWEGIRQIEQRLRGRIEEEARRTAGAIEEELLGLRRRREEVRSTHLKPLAYRMFWSVVGEETV